MRTKFTFKTHRLFAAVALMATLLAAKASKAQAQFEAGRTYYVNGVGNDLVSPKDTFISLAGTGAVYTGGLYSAATGIFPALNVNGIDSNTLGQITILLVPNYTGVEVNSILLRGVLFSSPNRPIVLKPSGTYTITRSALTGGDAVIRLEGTQYFTIDGESTLGQRNLTVIPPASAPSGNHKVIEIVTNQNIAAAVSAVNTVTIKNTNITGLLSANNSITQAGVFAGGLANFSTSGSRRAEKISVINCNIQNVQQGVHVRGLSAGASSHDFGLVIKNNIIGGEVGTFLGSVAQNQAGISISNQANVLIEGNTISGISPNTIHFAGIFVTNTTSANTSSLDSNVVINANKIYNLKSTTAASAVYGIRFYHNISYSRNQNMGYKVTNNVISNISSFGTTGNYLGNPTIPPTGPFPTSTSTATFPAGIAIEEYSTNASFEVYNNSIAMWDEGLKGTSAACIYVGFNTTGGIKLMNNILSNRMKNFTNDEGAYQVSGIIINSNSEPFDSIDNNVYDISTTGGWAYIARNLTRTYASLQEWRNYTKDDENSLTVKPVFDNPLTLSTLNGAPTTYGTQGKTLMPFDVTGAARPASNQSIGAYQFTQNTSLAPAPLQGNSTYMINGVSSLPTNSNLSGSFKNLADFVSHLNSYGTAGNDTIKVIFDNGYNTSGGDSLAVIPAVIPYPGMAATRKIVLRTAPGVAVTVKLGSNLRIPGNSAVFRLLGVSDFNILGRGSNNERSITFSLSDTAWAATSKVVSISSSYFSPASRDIITYCNIHGNAFSPSSVIAPVVYTAAGIYLGDPFPINATGLASALYGPNLNNVVNNNFIGGVKTGIYWGAKDSVTDQLNNINYNVIGGSMTVPGGRGRVYLIGGAVNQSGIYIKGLSTSTIDSNIVRNSHNSFTGFAGIFLNGSATIGRSKDLNVTKNTIYNLGCASANIGYAVGIRVGVNEANRSIRIQNNFITKIYGAGGNNFSTVSAPSGIAVFMDPAMTPGAAVINLGLNISHNTINLPQYPGLDIGPSQYTAAFFVGDRVAGLRVINNIFANTAGKSSYGAAASTVAAIAFGGTRIVTTDAFSQIEGNVYYANGRFCANFVGLKNGVNVLANNVLQTITELKAYAGFDNLSSFGEVPFLNDTTIQMNPYYIGHIVKNPDIFTEATVDKDITGAARPAGVDNTSVGALHINPLTAYEPLYGGYTYQVTGVLSPPSAGQQTGQFNTINNLFRYINTNGVDEDQFPIKTVTIEITSGYAGEGDTAISPLMKYPQMSPFRFIYIKPAPGVSPVIASTGATNASAVDGITSVIKIQGARNVTIDGSNNGSNSRDLTIRMALPTGGNALNIQSQAARVIDVMGWERPAEDNVIKNCNIIGNSTLTGINTYAGIYQGGINNFGTVNNNVPTNSIRIANSRNAYINNYIIAVKHGIYLRGGVAATASDVGVTVSQNIIGGNNNIGGALPTDYFGGGAVVSPSFMYASAIAAFTQTQLTIDSNIIQNSLSAIPGTNPVLGNAGIEIGAASSKVKISRNIITRIRATNTASTILSAGACGVYVNVPWTEKRSINIENNMISRIVGTVNNTYGICLDGSPNTTNDIDVNIYHNSINLSNLDTTSGIAACIGGSAFAKGDIRIENNILQNRIVRVTPNTANYIFHSTYALGNPFLAVDNNNYFVGGPNATNNMALIGSTTVTSFVNWVNYTKQDTLSLNYAAPFTNENNLFIPAGTTSPLFLGGRKIPTILTDILGTVRPAGLAATIGAHDFSGNGFFSDSMAPKLYDYTPLPDYCNGDFSPIIVKARVLDRNPVLKDTLYYTLNGILPELYVTATVVDGYNRTYEIPGQPANTLIAYRISAVDGALKSGDFVNSDRNTKRNYTTTTIGNFPIAIGFDAPNIYAFKTQQISGTQGWNLESFGSQINPFLYPQTGAKAALLPASAGSASRILTPCLDFSNMKLPVIRLYVSQNSDNANQNDSIIIKKWFGFDQYIPVIPINPIKRVNPNPAIATPHYKVYDVCLKEMNGASGFKFSVEGFSKGGSNLIIDSIIILDNFVDHDVAAVDVNSCFNDSFSIQVSNTSPQNEYYLYDDITTRVVSVRGTLGNGGTLTLKGYISTVDSARIKVLYTNITALGCDVDPFELTKFVSIKFNTFKDGPFVKKGDAFFGMLNDGTIANPDAVRVGGTADFEIRPPGTSTNADYGTSWTVAQVELRNYNNSQLNTTSLSIVPATPSTPAFVRFTGEPADSNKLFKMSIVLRLLPRGCDSVIVRYVRVSNAPVASFYAFNDTLCQGQGILFNNNTSNGVFSLPVTYQWDFGDGDSSTGITPVKSFSAPGTYKVTLRATNTSTLVDSVSFTFVVNPAPTASYTYSTPCSYKPVTFTNTSSIGDGITYAWNIAGQLRTDTSPVVIIPYSDTLVSVRLIVRNAEGCTDTAGMQTAVFAQPVASFTANNVCAGASVQFNNASTIAPGKENRENQIGYEWHFGNGEIGYSEDPLYKYPLGGSYNVTLKVISNFGCTDTISAPVSVFDKPVSNFTFDNACKSTFVAISNNSTYSGGLDKVNYKWDFGDNSPLSYVAVPTNKQYGEARSFFVTLVVTDTVHYCSDSLTKLVSVKESAKAEFTAENGCVGAPVVFTNVSVVPAGVTPSYAWTFGDGGTSANASTNHAYTTGGSKSISFTVDIDGCKSVALDTISISEAPVIDFGTFTDNDSVKYTFVASSRAFSKYQWNFGDGSSATGGFGQDSAENTYAREGTYTVILTVTDNNGCSAIDSTTVRVVRTVGVKEDMLTAKFKFNVYPNPFSVGAKVTFEMENRNDVTLEIYDMLGRKVFTRNEGELSAGKHEIDFNESSFNAKAGAYLVKVNIGGQIITRQLIKQQ